MQNLPPLTPDPVIEAYKKDVDRTLLRENLKLNFAERLERLQQMESFRIEMQENWRRAKQP